MSVTITVTPNITFASSERITADKLNLIGVPVASGSGTITSSEISDDLVAPNVQTLDPDDGIWTMVPDRIYQFAQITLDQDVTLVMTGVREGMVGLLFIQQDGTGGWTMTLPGNAVVAGDGMGAISVPGTASSWHSLGWNYDGVNLLMNLTTNYT